MNSLQYATLRKYWKEYRYMVDAMKDASKIYHEFAKVTVDDIYRWSGNSYLKKVAYLIAREIVIELIDTNIEDSDLLNRDSFKWMMVVEFKRRKRRKAFDDYMKIIKSENKNP